MTNRVIDHIVSKVIQHHHDSDTIEDSDISISFFNSFDNSEIEVGTGSDDVAVGIVIAGIIELCERNGTSIETCLNAAYDEIRGIK